MRKKLVYICSYAVVRITYIYVDTNRSVAVACGHSSFILFGTTYECVVLHSRISRMCKLNRAGISISNLSLVRLSCLRANVAIKRNCSIFHSKLTFAGGSFSASSIVQDLTNFRCSHVTVIVVEPVQFGVIKIKSSASQ